MPEIMMKKIVPRSPNLIKTEFLLDIPSKLCVLDTLDDVLDALLDMVLDLIGADRCSIFLNDHSTNELYTRVAKGNLKHEIRILIIKNQVVYLVQS